MTSGGTASVGLPPAITPESEPFWSAANTGRLLVERCVACGALSHPPHGICRSCHGRDIAHVEITGPGRVYSFTVNHQRWLPDLEVPFVLVWVEFPDEAPGVRVVGRLRGVEPDEVCIDMPVRVGFEAGPGGQAVPSFVAEPASAGSDR